MRAKRVPIRKLRVFDFDDTLVKTDAKVHVIKNGKRIKSMTPEEYNFYKPKPDEELDMSEFSDPRFIISAKKYKMWPVLKNTYMAKELGRSKTDIVILTARSPKSKTPIYNFLKNNGINIPEEDIYTVGNDEGIKTDISQEKKKILQSFVDEYDSVEFFDDSHDNINLANQIDGISTRLVDGKNI